MEFCFIQRKSVFSKQQQQGTNKHWDPVLTIYLILFLPLGVQAKTGIPWLLFGGAQQQPHIPSSSLLLDPFLCRHQPGSFKKGFPQPDLRLRPFPAAGPLFVPSAAWILQKGVPRNLTSDLLPFPAAGPLFVARHLEDSVRYAYSVDILKTV